jgi:hypothetical protein
MNSLELGKSTGQKEEEKSYRAGKGQRHQSYKHIIKTIEKT